jgi:1-acyl-sn-glycerol-3-phosphate acyltransferase
MGEFKSGAAALAIKYDLPILPVAIVGAYAAWPPDAKKVRPGRPPVYLAFGKPISPKSGETVEKFNASLRRTVCKLHDDIARINKLPTQAEIKATAERK